MQPFATPPELPADSAHNADVDGAAFDGATLAGNPLNNSADENGEIAPLQSGARVGPYEVRAHVGDGGMASVYRAWHTGLHREEALKIPRQQGRFGPEAAFVRRLLAEARTVAALHHPNIAVIHAVSEADAPLQYFSMELVGGGDLARLLEERGSLSPDESLPILSQIASALDYAHASGVIHRDIKPANVLLGSEGNAKVVDFGISRAGEELGGTRLTRTGMIVGTPEYMSPEQSGSGDAVGSGTDIYSLGVVAYEMLCGAPPFVAGDGVNRLSILMKHVGEAPEAPTRRAPDLPPAASAVVLKALAKKPEDRFATCGEFVQSLASSLEGATFLGGIRGRRARALTAMRAPARPTTRAFSDAAGTVEMEAATQKALRVSRLTTLIAGIGGLLAGAIFVWSWLGRDDAPPSLPAVVPKTVVSRPAPTRIPQQLPPQISAASPELKTPASLKRIETRKEILPFKRRKRSSSNLARGQKKIVQTGRNGQAVVREEIVTRDGKIASRRILSRRVVRAPRDEITTLGTRAEATRPVAPRPIRAAQPRAAPTPDIIVRAKPKPRVRSGTKRAAPRRLAPAKPRARVRTEVRAKARAVRRAPRRIAPRRGVRRNKPRRTPRRRPRGGDAPLPP